MATLREKMKREMQASRAFWYERALQGLGEEVAKGWYDSLEEALADCPEPKAVTDADVEHAAACWRKESESIKARIESAGCTWPVAVKARWLVHAEMLADRYASMDTDWTPMESVGPVTGLDEVRVMRNAGLFQFATDEAPRVAYAIPKWLEPELAAARARRKAAV